MFCFGVKAQNKKIEKANAFYEQMNYPEALKLYLENESKLSIPEHLGLLKIKIASCYSNLHQPALAVENYEKAILFHTDFTDEQNIDYANCMIEIGQYEEAKKFLQSLGYGFIEKILLEKCDYAISNTNINKNLKLYKLNELPADPSSGISYYRDNLLYVFSKEHQDSKSNPGIFGYLGRNDKTVTSLSDFNFPRNSNSPVIDLNSLEIYFGCNASYLKKIEGGRIDKYIGTGGMDNQFIFSKNLDNKKQPAKKLPFNYVDYSCTHPCISKDGNTMYFASNMLGGYGGFDIYISKKNDGVWGTPQNLGTKINSYLNEGYPYLDGNCLYFSSEGLPGFGGLDVFKYNLETEEINNLGRPINSSYDDFYFIKKSAEGYFVSNRSEEEAKDIIYKFVEK